ncbi:hypothetical protein FRB91_004978 [Serendipita sp. 411]|nr:hypothetical protein FRB91_004978 [Serendipita sp. 411]
MKDNNALLANYGLKGGSTVTLIGTSTPLPKARDTSASSKPTLPRTQEGILITIKAELDNVQQKIHPSLEAFLNSISSSEEIQEPRIVNPTPENLQLEHTRLGELLLQSLLRLDAINPDSEWEDARKARKAAVKEVQADLDKLDTSWKEARSRAVPANGSTEGTASAGDGGPTPKSKSKRRK